MKSTTVGTKGLTIVELMIAVSISVIALGAVYTGAMSMQRCFAASQSFADAKKEQTRLSDYLAMDVRRADKIIPGGTDGLLLTLNMQDFYDDSGNRRTPTITKYVHSYGDASNPMVVRYLRSGQYIYRQERNEPPTQIASGIENFQVALQDGGRIAETTVTFKPKFNRTASGGNEVNTVRTTTLLRNFHRITP